MADETVMAGEAYAVGPLDLILLLSFVGLVVYWFMRKRSEMKPELDGLIGLKQINTQTLSNLSTEDDDSGIVGKMKKSGLKI